MAVNLALEMLRQEDNKFKAILGYIAHSLRYDDVTRCTHLKCIVQCFGMCSEVNGCINADQHLEQFHRFREKSHPLGINILLYLFLKS